MNVYSQNNRNYYLKNKERIKEKHKDNKKKFPWRFTLTTIKQRCENPKNIGFSNYGGRGIKCLITEEQIKFLWFRDKAYAMRCPTINRKDNDGNYIFDNCEFIEKGKNTSERNKRICSKPVLQFDLEGNFIKEWTSVKEASIDVNIDKSQIARCARNCKYSKFAGGFIWRYKRCDI